MGLRTYTRTSVEVTFNGSQTINEIDVFSVQDNYLAPVTPTEAMTFTLYGLTAFDVQYLDGVNWVTVTGGNVSGNNKVWRKLTFAPVTTPKIRIVINDAADHLWSRITEIEAYTVGGAPPPTFNAVSVASGISNPTAMAFAPDGRLFVCQQTGQLRVIENGALLPTPFVTYDGQFQSASAGCWELPLTQTSPLTSSSTFTTPRPLRRSTIGLVALPRTAT